MMLEEGYNLRLYVAGQTPKSVAAIANLKGSATNILLANMKSKSST